MKNGRPSELFPLLAAIDHTIARDQMYYEKYFCNGHWIEKQGRCEKSIVRSSINKLYETTVDVGGIVLESGDDFVNLFQQKNTNTQK